MKILIEESVLRQALEVLETTPRSIFSPDRKAHRNAITALHSALDAAEKVEPVAWFCEDESTLSFAKMRGCDCIPLYPAPAVPSYDAENWHLVFPFNRQETDK